MKSQFTMANYSCIPNQLEKLEAAKVAWFVWICLVFQFCCLPGLFLLGLIGPHCALLGLTVSSWALMGLTDPYWSLLVLTGPYWALLGLTFAFAKWLTDQLINIVHYDLFIGLLSQPKIKLQLLFLIEHPKYKILKGCMRPT